MKTTSEAVTSITKEISILKFLFHLLVSIINSSCLTSRVHLVIKENPLLKKKKNSKDLHLLAIVKSQWIWATTSSKLTNNLQATLVRLMKEETSTLTRTCSCQELSIHLELHKGAWSIRVSIRRTLIKMRTLTLMCENSSFLRYLSRWFTNT